MGLKNFLVAGFTTVKGRLAFLEGYANHIGCTFDRLIVENSKRDALISGLQETVDRLVNDNAKLKDIALIHRVEVKGVQDQYEDLQTSTFEFIYALGYDAVRVSSSSDDGPYNRPYWRFTKKQKKKN